MEIQDNSKEKPRNAEGFQGNQNLWRLRSAAAPIGAVSFTGVAQRVVPTRDDGAL